MNQNTSLDKLRVGSEADDVFERTAAFSAKEQ
jgi:hypothetical protein